MATTVDPRVQRGIEILTAGGVQPTSHFLARNALTAETTENICAAVEMLARDRYVSDPSAREALQNLVALGQFPATLSSLFSYNAPAIEGALALYNQRQGLPAAVPDSAAHPAGNIPLIDGTPARSYGTGLADIFGPLMQRPAASPPLPTDPGPVRFVALLQRTFGLDLFKTIAQNSGDANVFFSPFSIASVLGMLMAGARGETRDKIANTLGLVSTQAAEAHRLYSALAGRLGLGANLSIANAIYVAQRYKLAEDFRRVAEGDYRGEAGPMAPGMEGEINAWIAAATKNMITDMLKAGTIDAMTAVMLVNAIYFKGIWTDKFDIKSTRHRTFRAPTGGITVLAMHQSGKYRYLEDTGSQSILLPYSDGQYAMAIVLPKNPEAFRTRPGKTSDAPLMFEYGLSALLSEPEDKQEGTIYIPRFKAVQDLDLKGVLSAMGMGIAFGEDADLTGLVEDTPPEGFFVSQARHRAMVDVDEEGTRAAAATYAKVAMRGISHGPQPFVFDVNHPCAYGIVNIPTGLPVFMGVLNSPMAVI